MKSDEVFGISPKIREHSYVDRGHLDSTLQTYLARTTHIAIRGPSKCGKSWLRQKSLKNPLVVQCRLGIPPTAIYIDALSQLGIQMTIKEAHEGAFKASLSATGEAGLSLLGKIGFTGTVSHDSAKTTDSQPVGHDINDLRYVANIINASGRRLVIEDFHYLSPDTRRHLAFDLKALWDYDTFVIIVGVWSESNLLLHLNPDLTGRVHEIGIDWIVADLEAILRKGAAALNLEFHQDISTRLCGLSYSNAGILQALTLKTLDEAKIYEKKFFRQDITNLGDVTDASMEYAEQLNPVYQQFAKRVAAGIRTKPNSTGIYAHAMAVVMEASDEELMKGLNARKIFERAHKRQNRIQFGNLKKILDKIPAIQVDDEGRGLILDYSPATEEITVVDRQLLLYRQYSTLTWPWEDLVSEADSKGGQLEAE